MATATAKRSENDITGEYITGLKSLSLFGVYDDARHMWQRQLETPSGNKIVIFEDPNHAGIGGEFFLWPASLVLTDYLFRNPSLVHDRNVLELGSSHGLVAMAARAVGAHRVLATDKQDSSGFLSQNIAANSAHQVEVAALDWGIDMEAWGAQHGWEWDIVLGSDLTFNRDCFLPLLLTLQQLVSRTHLSAMNATNLQSDNHVRRILLLHDDDSVPGGQHLRLDFFQKAAPPYFHVTSADLKEVDPVVSSLVPHVKLDDAAFHSPTVHGYWLTLKNDAPKITAGACAEALQKWNAARARETAREAAASIHTRRPGLGVTLPELIDEFSEWARQPAKLQTRTADNEQSTPSTPNAASLASVASTACTPNSGSIACCAPRASTPPNSEHNVHTEQHSATSHERQTAGAAGGEGGGDVRQLQQLQHSYSTTSPNTREIPTGKIASVAEGADGVVSAEGSVSPAPSVSPTHRDSASTEPLCIAEADKMDKAGGREQSGARWWDEELEEPEPFELTEAMLRGVRETRPDSAHLSASKTWESMVAEEASKPFRDVEVDVSVLPSLADNDSDTAGEGEEGEEMEKIVDLDVLRAEAMRQVGLHSHPQGMGAAQNLQKHRGRESGAHLAGVANLAPTAPTHPYLPNPTVLHTPALAALLLTPTTGAGEVTGAGIRGICRVSCVHAATSLTDADLDLLD